MRSKHVFYGFLMGLLWHPYKISMMFLFYNVFIELPWGLCKFSMVFCWISMMLPWDLKKVPMGFP